MRSSFLWLMTGVFAAFCAADAAPVFQANTNPDSGLSIQVQPWLSSKPPVGYIPVTVKVDNGSGGAGSWTLTGSNLFFRGGISMTNLKLEVRSGASASIPFLAPGGFASETRSGSYESTSFQINGTGIRYPNAGSLQSCSVQSALEKSYVALGNKSEKMFPWLNTRIDTAVGRSSAGIAGSKVEVRDTPVDWLGLSGLSGYWMSESEWRALTLPQKSAVQDWVALGGNVVIGAADGSSAGDVLKQTLPGLNPTGGTVSLGLGNITAVEPKDRLTEGELQSKFLITQNRHTTAHLLEAFADSQWKARDLVPAPAGVSAVMFAFIVMFAILIGPVNLFVFAGPTRRHRLFWTTPLISLAGSAVLLVTMLFSDGTGGKGVRLTVGIMVPELDRIVVKQEQLSRTGVLLGSSFPIAEPSLMNQLRLKSSGFSFASGEKNSLLMEDNGTRSGAWFQSRSMQAQALQTVRATRGEIRFRTEGEARSVVSSFDMPIRRLWLVDEEGKTWSAEGLNPGERKKLTASEAAFLVPSSKFWTEGALPKLAGPLLKDALETVGKAKNGIAFAEVETGSAGKLAIATLNSIAWQQDMAMLVGPYVTEPSNQP